MKVVKVNVIVGHTVVLAGTPVESLTPAVRAQIAEFLIEVDEPQRVGAVVGAVKRAKIGAVAGEQLDKQVPLEPVAAAIDINPAPLTPYPLAAETMVSTPAEINPPPSWAKGKV